jgi:hypothetical protein
VKTKEKTTKPEKATLLHATFFHCFLSKELLKEPIVGDKLGNLYNKEAILEFLLDRKKYGKEAELVCQHIKSLKDIINIQPTINLSEGVEETKNSQDCYHKMEKSRFVCPITRLELNGRYRFVFLKSCGCLLSEKAFKEIPSEDPRCLVCGKPYLNLEDNLIPVFPDGEELERLRERCILEAKIKHETKKETKRKLSSHENDPAIKFPKLDPSYLKETENMKQKSAVYRSIFVESDSPNNQRNDFLCRTFNRYI